jgi:uncharacterized protein
MASKITKTGASSSYLLDFSCQNFGSLRDRQTLSLVADKTEPLKECLVELPRQRVKVGCVAAIYGANASGKSTVLSAIEGAAAAVVDSHSAWRVGQAIPLRTFALRAESKDVAESVFNFVIDGVRYQYKFAASRERFVHEELNVWQTNRRQNWFVREGDELQFGSHLEGPNDPIAKLTRKNSLFLSAAAQNNHPTLSRLYAFFAGIAVRPPFGLAPLLDEEPSDADMALVRRLLRVADVGIEDVRIRPVELRVRTNNGELSRKSLFEWEFLHRGKTSAWLQWGSESFGTRMLVDFACNVSDILQRGTLLLVDELDRSMHTMLTRELVAAFQSRKQNPRGAQLVFSAHDTNLLDPELLRRDQIWFTEKDQDGATTLKPLTDFHVRGKESFGARYLDGRYGAVPSPGKFDLRPTSS